MIYDDIIIANYKWGHFIASALLCAHRQELDIN
jgi:hypothetical protein